MALALGCSSSDAERYDGAYGHQHWARVGFDYDDVNASGQYVVKLENARLSPEGSCSGVLIGPDQVLTAAHCVGGLTVRCPTDLVFRENEIKVIFDYQMKLDPPVFRRAHEDLRTGPITYATRVVAGADGVRFDLTSEACNGVREKDAVVLELARPIGLDRGWARMRETVPATGAFAPTIHHPLGRRKKVVLGRIMGIPEGDTILFVRMLRPLIDLESSSNQPVTFGSSGSPLFDPDGYVIATNRFGRAGQGDYVPVATRTAAFHLPPSSYNAPLAFVRYPRRETAHPMFGRIDASGNLDLVATHGTRGLGQRARAEAIVQRVNGGFITGGSASVTPMAVSSPVLIAYDAAGVEDPMFGLSGVRQLPIAGASMASVRGLAIQSVMGKERILAVGGAVSESNPDSSGIFITRRLETGAPDTAFAMGSADLRGEFLRPVLPALRDAVATAVAIDSQGRIVVAGSGWTDGLIGGRPCPGPSCYACSQTAPPTRPVMARAAPSSGSSSGRRGMAANSSLTSSCAI